jgi:hypothetical protein
MIKKFNQYIKEDTNNIENDIRQYFYEITDNYDVDIKFYIEGNKVSISLRLGILEGKITKDSYLTGLEIKKKISDCVYYLELEELIQNPLFMDSGSHVHIYCTLFGDDNPFFKMDSGNYTTIYINDVNLKKDLDKFNFPIDWKKMEHNNLKWIFIPFKSDPNYIKDIDKFKDYMISNYDIFSGETHIKLDSGLYWYGFKLKDEYRVDIDW